MTDICTKTETIKWKELHRVHRVQQDVLQSVLMLYANKIWRSKYEYKSTVRWELHDYLIDVDRLLIVMFNVIVMLVILMLIDYFRCWLNYKVSVVVHQFAFVLQ